MLLGVEKETSGMKLVNELKKNNTGSILNHDFKQNHF